MSVSNRVSRSLAVLLVLAAPWGAAQEPDYEAVGDRLLEAVEEGELSAEQAKAMMGALASQRMAERLANLEDEEDDDEWEEAWDELSGHYRKLGLSEQQLKKLVAGLEEVGLEDERLFETLGAMVKLSWMLRKGDVDAEAVEAFNDYFADELDLEEEQRDRVWGLAKRIAGAGGKRTPSEKDMAAVKTKIWAAVEAGELTEEQAKQKWEAYVREVKRGRDRDDLWVHYQKLGVSKADMGEIKRALVGAELEGERLERALRVIVRIARGLREADDPEPLLAKVSAHLSELDFDERQVEAVLRIARKLAADHPEERGEDDRAR